MNMMSLKGPTIDSRHIFAALCRQEIVPLKLTIKFSICDEQVEHGREARDQAG